MSKIIRAVNSMIQHEDKISNVKMLAGKYFFMFDGKYKWSMSYDGEDDDFYLNYYPGKEPLELIMDEVERFNQVDYITYCIRDLGTKEARESFQELYTMVKEKLYGVDQVLDDIINIDDIPF